MAKVKGKSQRVDITFPDPTDAGRRPGVFPTRREDEIFTRRNTFVSIKFWDLAQIKTVLGAYEDHPILKTPSYIATPTYEGGGNLLGALYTFEDFTDADYQAFIDSIFALGQPSEWKDIFKRIDYEHNPTNDLSYPAHYPTTLRMYDPVNGEGVVPERFMEAAGSDISTEIGRASRDFYLNTVFNMAWNSRGLEYKNFNEIRYRNTSSETNEWFSAGTDTTSIYKVTASYDYDAPDVSGLVISGPIECYLIPQIGLFMAVSARSPLVLGQTDPEDGYDVMFGYQVLPRAHWPYYLDPYNQLDLNLLSETYLDYQKNRDGMAASFWQKVEAGATDTISESPLDPLTWGDSGYSFYSRIDNDESETFYGNGGETFNAATEQRFVRTAPFLMAVLKIRGAFYYVWCHAGDEFGNQASDETAGAGGYDLGFGS